MTDCNFPIIEYDAAKSSYDNGLAHGETFSTAIKELVAIRKQLMLNKNPALKPQLEPLAQMQINVSKEFSPEIWDELRGIAVGSGVSETDIVILNNYTDFRDIQLPEEGCSTIYCKNKNHSMAGQTWDMHSSAKNYICLIHLGHSLVFSLVGCVGMMGINERKLLVGVNNVNTQNAKTGLIWPVLVRKSLEAKTLKQMKETILHAPVTSGHNYIIGDFSEGYHIETSPGITEIVGSVHKNEMGNIFHTNHCLGERHQKVEQKDSMSSTTFARFDILEKRLPKTNNHEDLIALFKDHENYPKSICSHYESGAQDPSFTCGGGTLDFQSGKAHFWRGCKEYDDNYKEYTFVLEDNEYKQS